MDLFSREKIYDLQGYADSLRRVPDETYRIRVLGFLSEL